MERQYTERETQRKKLKIEYLCSCQYKDENVKRERIN